MPESRHGHSQRSVLFRTVRIVGSVNAVSFIFTILTLLLFVMGNYQEFLDRSQEMLIQLVFFLGLMCVSTGVFYAVSLIAWMVRRRRLLLLRFFYSLVATAVGAAAALGIGFLQAVVQSS